MNSAEKVKADIAQWKAEGISKADLMVNIADDMIGWPYAWGSTGQSCTVAHRKQKMANPKISAGDIALIKKHCQILNGSKGVCNGCIYYPGGKVTNMHDCIGFVNKLLDYAGVDHYGAGCTTMWNHKANWDAQGPINNMPDTVCCVFRQSGNKMEHIGLHIGGGWVIHCSVEVKKQSNYPWTHYGIPKGLGGIIPPVPPVPPPEPVPEGYAEVTGKKVALRKDPSLQANILLRVDTGETVKLEPLPPKEWDYVSYSGKTGWMMREFLREEVSTATVTGRKVALRKDPSKQASILMRIDTGAVVLLVDEPASEWDYVSYKGSTGYMMKKYLREGSEK